MTYSRINTQAEALAETIIGFLKTKKANPALLVQWIEDNLAIKINITYKTLFSSKISGMTQYKADLNIYEIQIEAGESPERQTFTLCHELAHVLYNPELIYGFNYKDNTPHDSIERFCDRFAAAFLMPKQTFIEKWINTRIENKILKIYEVARHFNVSRSAVKNRVLDLNIQT